MSSRAARQRWRLRREWHDLQRTALEYAEREGLDFIKIASPLLRKKQWLYTARGLHKLFNKFYSSGIEASHLVYDKPLLGASASFSSIASLCVPAPYAEGAT